MYQAYKLRNKPYPPDFRRGQAALATVVITLLVMVAIMLGISAIALTEKAKARTDHEAKRSYYLAEAGVEDVVYRIKNNKQYSALETLTLNSASATITTADIAGGEKEVVASGDVSSAVRKARMRIKPGTVGVSFYYGVQVSDGGVSMNNNAVINGNVYSNGSIVGSNGATISGDVIVAGGIDSTPGVEWTSQNADQTFGTASTNRDIAQSFTANETGAVPRVSVYLAKVGSPSQDISVRLTTDNGNKPNSSDLADVTIPASSVGVTPGWVYASFSSQPSVTSGQTYWIILDYGANSASNYWNWRKDTSDGYAGNTGKYTSSWSSGSAVWTDVGGDLAFRVWIGGTNTSISTVTIGSPTSGSARANAFTNVTTHGSACPNIYCIVDNPAREELPISDGVIQDWRDAAAAGGIITGNYTLDGTSASLGPKKITGNLVVDNNATLTITGTIWVLGDIQLSNGCIVQLSSSYGANSGVILTDDDVQVSNNCTFQGSGTAGSYVMILSAKNAPTQTAITISNNALGVIFYAGKGRIHFSNNATAKEATGYGIDMDNNATVTYESGLANASFSSGPAGGWDITNWQEIP